ncbi:MAG: hypothetical protein Ct9H300mP14_10120 [Gammaproteobacteria bacterium]|nr:MAG: hypothetical protein Ct9H300mP14_10120 [Gammaproteobacteria bacterium]
MKSLLGGGTQMAVITRPKVLLLASLGTLKVAVIGAGAAGPVAANELLKAGHEVNIFEQSSRLGGIWVYQAASEPDPLGQTGAAIACIHACIVATNLPRDLMAFFDFPFDSSGGVSTSGPAIPVTHRSRLTWKNLQMHSRYDTDSIQH